MAVCVFVNGERFEVKENVTVGALINLGGGNPEEYELQKRSGATGPVEQVYSDPAQVINLTPPTAPSGGQHASGPGSAEQAPGGDQHASGPGSAEQAPGGDQHASGPGSAEQAPEAPGGQDVGPVASVDECQHFTTRFTGTINPA